MYRSVDLKALGTLNWDIGQLNRSGNIRCAVKMESKSTYLLTPRIKVAALPLEVVRHQAVPLLDYPLNGGLVCGHQLSGSEVIA